MKVENDWIHQTQYKCIVPGGDYKFEGKFITKEDQKKEDEEKKRKREDRKKQQEMKRKNLSLLG